MTNDNIFSGLKVVDFASVIAGPAAAVILGDFGADVIKVEPPNGDLWRIGYKDLPIAPELIRRTRELLPKVKLVQVYGLSEPVFSPVSVMLSTLRIG